MLFTPILPASSRPLLRAALLILALIIHSLPARAAVVNIPPGPLSETISLFAQQLGIAVVMDETQMSGASSNGLQGNYSAEAGLAKLLKGSRYAARKTAEGFVIEVISETMLPTVKVTSAAVEESAYSPVNSYVAKRSSSGTKADIALVETPASVTVVPREQMEFQGADSIDQALDYSAGIISLDRGANRRGATGFVVRGFNVTGSGPLYLNGSKFPINSLSGAVDPYLYERVEVLRGPASILYGQAAPGGIINLVSKRVLNEPLREVGVQIGSWDRYQFQADFSDSLNDEDTLGYRVTGLYRDGDTMVDYIPDNRKSLGTVLEWTPSENTSLAFFATYYANDTVYGGNKPAEGTLWSAPNGKIDRSVFLGEPEFDRFDSDGTTLGYLFSHSFNNHWKMRQNALWLDYETTFDYMGRSNTLDTATHRTTTRSVTARLDAEDAFNIDTQIQGNWVGDQFEHTFLAGVDYTKHDFSRIQRSGSVEPLDVYQPVYGAPVTLNAPTFHDSDAYQAGVYVQEHMKFNQRWVALLGGRWDKASSDEVTETVNAEAVTLRAGALYLSNMGLAPYISYAESFQPQAGVDFSGNRFDPTTGRQYEVGVKYEPDEKPISLTVSVYELTQQNILTPDPYHEGSSVQTGEIRSRGAEVEGRMHFSNGFSLISAYAYTDAEVTRSNGTNLGLTPTHVSDEIASIWLDYNSLAKSNGFNAGAGFRYIGESQNATNTIKVPGYSLLDASVGYRFLNWRFLLNIKNLLDNDDIASPSLYYVEERNFTLSAVYNW